MDYMRPDNCLNANVRATTRAMTQYYDAMLRPSGLLSTQFAVLATLTESGTLSVKQFAMLMRMDPTTAARNLRPLARNGWVNIDVGISDRRERIISLTDAGRRCYDNALPLWQQAQQHIRDYMGADVFDRLLAGLQTLSDTAQNAHDQLMTDAD